MLFLKQKKKKWPANILFALPDRNISMIGLIGVSVLAAGEIGAKYALGSPGLGILILVCCSCGWTSSWCCPGWVECLWSCCERRNSCKNALGSPLFSGAIVSSLLLLLMPSSSVIEERRCSKFFCRGWDSGCVNNVWDYKKQLVVNAKKLVFVS